MDVHIALSQAEESQKIPKRRTKTGCRECRVARVKCSEGSLDGLGRKLPCTRCVRNTKDCYYPSSNGDGWVQAPNKEEVVTCQEVLEALDHIPLSPDSAFYGSNIASSSSSLVSPSSLAAPALLSEFVPSTCLAEQFLGPPTKQKRISSPTLDVATGASSSYESYYSQPQAPSLSPQGRISLFDAAVRDDGERLLLSYLFSGSFQEIGSYGVSNPQKDHFQSTMLPYLAWHLTTTARGLDNEDDLMYYSALRLSSAHRRMRDAQSHQATDADARAVLTLKRVRSSAVRSEKAMIGVALYNLANALHGIALDLEHDDIEATVTTSIGFATYDVLCAYNVMRGIVQNTRIHAPVSAAGQPDLETTFGIARPMWGILARMASLCDQARLLRESASPSTSILHMAECSRTLEDSSIAVAKVDLSNRDRRICIGTKLAHHTVSILIQCEAMDVSRHDARIQASCRSILELLYQLLPEERLVGVDFALTIALCYTTEAIVASQLDNMFRETQARRFPSIDRSFWTNIAVVASSLHSLDGAVPWREALQVLKVPMLL